MLKHLLLKSTYHRAALGLLLATAPVLAQAQGGQCTATITANGSTTFCQGSVVLTASSGTAYAWSNGATTASITVSTGGSYTVMTTNAAGCSATSAATTVTVVPPPTVTATPSLTQVCAGAPVVLTAAAVRPAGTGSTMPDAYTYTWSGPGVPAGTTGQTLTVSPTTFGINTYTATATGTAQFNCSNSATVQVRVLPPPTVVAAANTASVCSGGAATLQAVATPPAGFFDTYTYTWTGAGLAANTTGASLSVLPTATTVYTVAATGNSQTGCAATATVTVQVNPTPATPVVTRNGAGLSSSSPTGNQWYLNGIAITGAVGATYTPTGPGTYTVVVFGAGNCPSNPSQPLIITAARGELSAATLEFYPSPTHDGRLNLTLRGYVGQVEVSVINAIGQALPRQSLLATGQTQLLNLGPLPTGIYTIQVLTKNGLLARRLVCE